MLKKKAKLCQCNRCRRRNQKTSSKYSGSYLQLRDIDGYEDDFSKNFKDTTSNKLKLIRFIKLWDEIKPHGYKPIQLWRVKTDVLARSVHDDSR